MTGNEMARPTMILDLQSDYPEAERFMLSCMLSEAANYVKSPEEPAASGLFYAR
jgi:hypothetical protein